MSVIRASITDQVLKITESPVVASGGQNEVKITFNFCEKWDGCVKTAIFYRDEDNAFPCILDEENTCVVPWEVCYENGSFYIGVFGDRDNTRRTSTVVRYRVKKGAITEDTRPSDPTPDVYNQIIAELEEIRNQSGGSGGFYVGDTPPKDTSLLWIDTSDNSGGGSTSSGGSSGGTLGEEEKSLMLNLFRNAAYTADMSASIAQLEELWNNNGGSGGEEEPDVPVDPDEPDEPVGPEVTLTSISATYSGGAVEVGTSVTALTGITVTAHYSNGTSATVTGYTLSGTIVEGSNTITVSYGGKTTIFTVTGFVKTYTVSAELVNVTSSNNATSVTEGASYTTTLTAADGYTLEGVRVAMGGRDITLSAYSNGVISIANVTGNINIFATAKADEKQAELITDGLIAYFDLRNVDKDAINAAGSVGTAYGIPTATKGSASLYSWGAWVDSTDDYGTTVKRSLTVGDENKANVIDLGTTYTFIGFTYGGYACTNHGSAGNGWSVNPKYKKTDGSAANVGTSNIKGNMSGNYDYMSATTRVDGAELAFYANGECWATFNGANYDGFSAWSSEGQCSVTPYNNSGKFTAFAMYNRALSDAEIVEIGEYFKTLEVE